MVNLMQGKFLAVVIGDDAKSSIEKLGATGQLLPNDISFNTCYLHSSLTIENCTHPLLKIPRIGEKLFLLRYPLILYRDLFVGTG